TPRFAGDAAWHSPFDYLASLYSTASRYASSWRGSDQNGRLQGENFGAIRRTRIEEVSHEPRVFDCSDPDGSCCVGHPAASRSAGRRSATGERGRALSNGHIPGCQAYQTQERAIGRPDDRPGEGPADHAW